MLQFLLQFPTRNAVKSRVIADSIRVQVPSSARNRDSLKNKGFRFFVDFTRFSGYEIT